MSFSSFFSPFLLFRLNCVSALVLFFTTLAFSGNRTDLGIIPPTPSRSVWTFTFAKLLWSGAVLSFVFFLLLPVSGWTQPWPPCGVAVLVSRVGFALVEWCPVFVCPRLKENNCVCVSVCCAVLRWQPVLGSGAEAAWKW